MTTTSLSSFASTEDRLRSVLRFDAVVTAAVGLLALAGPTDWYAGPDWLVRTVGAVLVLTGVEVALAARWSGRRLRLAGTVVAELAFAWVLGSAVVLATTDLTAEGTQVVVLVAVATLLFGLAETRLLRALR